MTKRKVGQHLTGINPKTGKEYYYKDNPETMRKRMKKWSPIHNALQMYVNGKYVPRSHPLHKPGRYKTFNDAAFASLQKGEEIKEGYVYAITNPAWPEWVNIGMAVDADDRCLGYQTSSPLRDYKVEHIVSTNNKRKSEAEAHKLASKMAKEKRGEWFYLDIEQVKNILNEITVDFKETG